MAERTCIVPECEKQARYANGWCPMHYQRWKRCGSLEDPKPREKQLCECGDPVHAKGLCRKCYRAEYYQRNKIAENAWFHAYYRANAEAMRARARKYHREHPERAKEHYRRNRQKQLARAKELRRDPERRKRALEYGKQWRRRNAEKWALRNRENQRRRRRVDGKPVDFAAILAEHGMFCHICWMVIADLSDLHFDHVVPLSRGGTHTPDNIRPAHAVCNLRKGARLTY